MSLVSLYDEASLWMTPSGVKDGKLYSELPVPEYGPEKVTNGNFATDSDWSKTNATISGGAATITSTGYAYAAIVQNNVLTIGKTYKATFNINSIIGGLIVDSSNTITNSGIASVTFTATNTYLDIRRDSSFATTTAEIDNVSVKEVLSVDGDFTFSRGSNLSATRVGADGLIEKGRENLLLQSNNFGTTWQTINASVTSGQSGYDGSSDAWLLTSTGGPLYQSISESGVVTFSVYAKANSGAGFLLRVDQTTQTKLEFNISTGAFISGSNYIDYNSTSIGNGWYRLSVVFLAASTTTAQFRITDGSGTNISGSAYIQDAQLEIGLAATEYIESGATTGKAGLLEDEPRLDYSGGATCPSLLLEPSRTNSVAQSEYFGNSSHWIKNNQSVTGNNTTAPDGYSSANLVIPSAGTADHYLLSSTINATNGQVTTLSIFVKKKDHDYFYFGTGGASAFGSVVYQFSTNTFVVSGLGATATDYGNGWIRLTITGTTNNTDLRILFTPTDSSNLRTFNANGTDGTWVWGAQSENDASYPTSYIPNHSGGTITRGADTQSQLTIPNGSATEGTIFYEFDKAQAPASYDIVPLKVGTNRILRISQYNPNMRFSINENATSYDESNSYNSHIKVAVSYSSSSVKLFINGVLRATDTTYSASGNVIIPANGLQATNIGCSLESKQLLYFPTALTDSECIELTINGVKEDLITAYKKRATTLEEGASERLDTYLQSLEDFIII